MPIASVLGWMMIIAVVVLFLNMRSVEVPMVVDALAETAEREKDRAFAWCNLMEEVFLARVFVFDPDFLLFAYGFNSQGKNYSGLHVVDIVSRDLAELFLGALSAAFRGDNISIPCSWEGKNVSLFAHRLDGGRVVVIIRGIDGVKHVS